MAPFISEDPNPYALKIEGRMPESRRKPSGVHRNTQNLQPYTFSPPSPKTLKPRAKGSCLKPSTEKDIPLRQKQALLASSVESSAKADVALGQGGGFFDTDEDGLFTGLVGLLSGVLFAGGLIPISSLGTQTPMIRTGSHNLPQNLGLNIKP